LNLDRLLKNSVHPSTELRANGISLEITSKYPFMLSQVEACKLFFNSLLNIELNSQRFAFSAKLQSRTDCRLNAVLGFSFKRKVPTASKSSTTESGSVNSGLYCSR